MPRNPSLSISASQAAQWEKSALHWMLAAPCQELKAGGCRVRCSSCEISSCASLHTAGKKCKEQLQKAN